MNNLKILSLLAGLCWGIWPFLLQKSGLTGNFSSFVFTAVILTCVAPFAFWNKSDLSQADWKMVVGAGIFSAMGLLSFNSMLEKATRQMMPSLFVLMIVVQTSIPALYDVLQNGITTTKALGFIAAIIAVILLNK